MNRSGGFLNIDPDSFATTAEVDASSSISLQFGSISPGLMNGMQIPSQTSSSAPPNLDGQKKDQACYDSLKAAPAVPTSSIPKQRLPIKDTREPNTGEVQPVSKSKRDVQVSISPPAPQTQKPSVHPMSGMSMQVQSHHSQFPVQFCVPNPQIQSQGTPNSPLPFPIQMGMSIPLPMGNPPTFVAGLQPPHVMQSQGLIHQGQNFNYSSQMGSHIPSLLGSMGINMTPQFPPQQAAKFTASRKSVKITHPETHEELRFDGLFPHNHLMTNYSTSYNSSSLFFPRSSYFALNSAQILPSSQPLRFSNQVCMQKCIENNSVGLASPQPSGVKEKVMLEPNVAKSTMPRREEEKKKALYTKKEKKKKKKKELYRKAEAAGTSSDLYMAYKGPEEKKETDAPAQSTDNTLRNTTDVSWDTAISSLKTGQSKVEPEDWEDAVDISTPNLPNEAKSTMPSQKKKKKEIKELYRKAKAAGTRDTVIPSLKTGQSKVEPEDWEDALDISTSNLTMKNVLRTKKYSRDYLLKFAKQCTDLPDVFEIPSNMVGAFMVSGINISHESCLSPGKKIDMPIGGSRADRRGSVMGDKDKSSKLMSGKLDMKMDIGYGGNVGFQPGQRGNNGVLANPLAQTPIQHAGEILAGPLGVLPRNNRWQRGTAFQKGLLPTPQTPLKADFDTKD